MQNASKRLSEFEEFNSYIFRKIVISQDVVLKNIYLEIFQLNHQRTHALKQLEQAESAGSPEVMLDCFERYLELDTSERIEDLLIDIHMLEREKSKKRLRRRKYVKK